MRKHFYGTGLVLLGSWEAVALASRGRVPTITSVCRCRRGAKAALLVWMGGAAWHVLGRG